MSLQTGVAHARRLCSISDTDIDATQVGTWPRSANQPHAGGVETIAARMFGVGTMDEPFRVALEFGPIGKKEVAYHTLEDAWEMEDRDLTVKDCA